MGWGDVSCHRPVVVEFNVPVQMRLHQVLAEWDGWLAELRALDMQAYREAAYSEEWRLRWDTTEDRLGHMQASSTIEDASP